MTLNSNEKEQRKAITGDVWILGDLRNHTLFETSLNVLAGAAFPAMSLSGKKVFVIISSSSNASNMNVEIPPAHRFISNEEAIRLAGCHGADKILFIHPEASETNCDNPDGTGQTGKKSIEYEFGSPHETVRLLAEAVSLKKPAFCLFPLNDRMREIAARSAFLSHSGMIADSVGFKYENDELAVVCPSYGGEVMATLGFTDSRKTGFVTVQPNAFQKKYADTSSVPVEEMSIELSWGEKSNLKLISRSREPAARQSLETAEKIVVGGAGLGNIDGFRKIRKLAAALGAEVGATRPPVLWHWADDETLIGQTGKTVNPKLLISVGTSGAVQYTAGITGADKIIAINKDPDAPIFRIADIGIVADAAAFLPLLTDRIQKASLRSLADAMQTSEGADHGSDFGSRLMGMRKAHNLDLENLAQKIGLAPELLEDLENNRTTPSVGLMLKLAEVFDIDAGAFLNEKERSALSGKRVEEYVRRTDNYYYQTLTPGAENEHLRVFLVTIESDRKHKPVSYRHEGEEFIYVMEGKLELMIGNKVHKLMQGESMKFNSENPHQLKSLDRKMTKCLVTLYTP